jgi:uncharacterized protein YukE
MTMRKPIQNRKKSNDRGPTQKEMKMGKETRLKRDAKINKDAKLEKVELTEEWIESNFQKDLEDLRKINDALFYSELKNSMKDHLARFEVNYQTSTKAIEGMKNQVRRVPMDIDQKMDDFKREVSKHSYSVFNEAKKEIENSLRQSEARLGVLVDRFIKLQTNFVALQNNFSHLYSEQQMQREDLINGVVDKIKNERETLVADWEQWKETFESNYKQAETILRELGEAVKKSGSELRHGLNEVKSHLENNVNIKVGQLEKLVRERFEELERLISEENVARKASESELFNVFQETAATQLSSTNAQFEQFAEKWLSEHKKSNLKQNILLVVVAVLAVGEALLLFM